MDSRSEPRIDPAHETAGLRRIARAILCEPSLAEDAVQEAWLAALRLSGRTSPTGGWLTEAVRRIAHGMRRESARRGRREQAAARGEALPSAAETVARMELLRHLVEALSALEEPYRTALRLRLVEDLPPRAIARRLRVPVETVRTRVRRGLAHLRADLDARHADRRGEFLAALAPLAGLKLAGIAAGTSAGGPGIGGWIVGTKTKIGMAAALAIAGCVWWAQPWKSAEDRAGSAHDVAVLDAAAPMSAPAEIDALRPGSAPLAAVERESGPGSRRSASAGGNWRVAGRALLGTETPFPAATVAVRIRRGYVGTGEVVFDGLVTSDSQGGFGVELPTPNTALRVTTAGRMDGYLGFEDEALIVRGGPAPRDLVVRLYPLDVRVRGLVLGADEIPIPAARVAGRGQAAITDSAGRFEVLSSSLLQEEHLEVSAPGHAQAEVVVETQGRTSVEGLLIRLEAGASLRGRVVDRAGSGIEAASIESLGNGSVRAQSGAGGHFVLEGLSTRATWISIWVRAPGYAVLRHDFEDGRVPGEELEFVLEHGVDVPGRVVDGSGSPLAGADVFSGETSYEWAAVHTVSDDDGRFVLASVPSSERHVGASLQGFAPWSGALDLHAGQPFAGALSVVLRQGRAVKGVVVDEAGAPIAGVHVSVERDRSYLDGVEARTAEDGTFELLSVPDGSGLMLECYGRGYTRLEVPLDPARVLPLRLVMARSGGLAGRVVDARTGDPVASFRVRFVAPRMLDGDERMVGYSATWVDPGREIRDELGRWGTSDEQIAIGQVTGIEVIAPGYGPTIVPRAVVTADPDEHPIRVEMRPGVRVEGRVVEAAGGRPVANALVRRTTPRAPLAPWEPYEDGERVDVRTDENGVFAMEGLPLEAMSLYVEVRGFAPAFDGPFDVSGVTPTRRIELRAGASLRGVLFDVHGVPLAHEPVDVDAELDGMASRRSWELETDEQGRFGLRDLNPGDYQVSRRLPTDSGAVFDLTRMVRVDGAAEVEVELRPGGTGRIAGTLAGTAGTDECLIVRAELEEADGRPTEVWRSAVARNRSFVIDGVQAGHWKLSVCESAIRRGGMRTGSAVVDVSDGGLSHVVVSVSGP